MLQSHFFPHKNQVAAQFIFNLNNNGSSVQPKFTVKTYHLVHHNVRTMNEATLLGELPNRFSFMLGNFLQVLKVHFHEEKKSNSLCNILFVCVSIRFCDICKLSWLFSGIF